MRVRTGLAIRIHTAPLMRDERVHNRRDIVLQLANEPRGAGVVRNHDESAGVVDCDLAGVIAHGVHSGYKFKIGVESEEETGFLLGYCVVVIVSVDDVGDIYL